MPAEGPRHNAVLLSLSLVGLLVWLGFDAVSVAPNRIVPGTAHGVADVALGVVDVGRRAVAEDLAHGLPVRAHEVAGLCVIVCFWR